jgi:hypothetical protein
MLHPECQPDETFVGNTSKQDFVRLHLNNMEGVRLGKQAYDIYGEALPPQYTPVFVKNTHLAAYNSKLAETTSRYKQGIPCRTSKP